MKLADNSWNILLVDMNISHGFVKLSFIDWVLPRWLEVTIGSYLDGSACPQLTAGEVREYFCELHRRLCEPLLNKPCFTRSGLVNDYRGTKAYIDIMEDLARSSSFLPKDRG